MDMLLCTASGRRNMQGAVFLGKIESVQYWN